MYILFLPRVGLYVSFLPLANAQGKTSWHKGLPMVKTIYTYGFHELFLKLNNMSNIFLVNKGRTNIKTITDYMWHMILFLFYNCCSDSST